ncbi:hypothetical protein EMMF5_001435 [Cystobasidiomycetes sp. EMM_F5]
MSGNLVAHHGTATCLSGPSVQVPPSHRSVRKMNSLSSLASPPTTPRSLRWGNGFGDTLRSASTSYALHEYAQMKDASSSDLPAMDEEDRFTQMPSPLLSHRERYRARSSSISTSTSIRKRKSLASLHNTPAMPSPPTFILAEHTPSLTSTLTYGQPNLSVMTLDTPPISTRRTSLSPRTHVLLDGRRLSRRHIEASRRSAKEALEEDLRARHLSQQGSPTSDDYACELAFSCTWRVRTLRRDASLVDCYFTSLDYLLKAVKVEIGDSDHEERTRRAMRARLQAAVDSLTRPEDLPPARPDLGSIYDPLRVSQLGESLWRSCSSGTTSTPSQSSTFTSHDNLSLRELCLMIALAGSLAAWYRQSVIMPTCILAAVLGVSLLVSRHQVRNDTSKTSLGRGPQSSVQPTPASVQAEPGIDAPLVMPRFDDVLLGPPLIPPSPLDQLYTPSLSYSLSSNSSTTFASSASYGSALPVTSTDSDKPTLSDSLAAAFPLSA